MELAPQSPEVTFTFIGNHQDSDLGRNDHAMYRMDHRGKAYSVLFYAPNEIPTALPDSNRVALFGDKPKTRVDEDWESFKSEVSDRSGDVEGRDVHSGDLIVLESSPVSLIRLALALDPSNKDLTKLIQEVNPSVGGERFREFTDLVIAGKFIDKNGNVKLAPDNEGEVLMLQALLGDKVAENDLANRKNILSERDSAQFDNQNIEVADSNSELTMDDLVVVHATDHLPVTEPNGEKIIRSTFDGSGQKTPRSTIHFALNHQVSSHRYGNWANKKYVIVAPLQGVINLNGRPVSMRAEDTYFITSPGEPLRLPAEVVVIDDTEERDLTSNDLDEVAEYCDKMFWGEHFSKGGKYDPENRRMFGNFSYRHPGQFNNMEDFIDMQFRNMQDRISKGYGTIQELPQSSRPFYTRLTDVLMRTRYKKHSALRDKVLQIITDKGRKIERKEFEKIYSNLEGELNKYFKAIRKKKRVDEIITGFGAKVQDVDPQYLEEMDLAIEGNGTYSVPDFEQEVESLGTRLGIVSERHPKSAEERCESSAYHYLIRVKDKAFFRDSQERSDNLNQLRSDVRANALKLRPASRRMHYLIGTI